MPVKHTRRRRQRRSKKSRSRRKQRGGTLQEYKEAVEDYLQDSKEIYTKYVTDSERDGLTNEYVAELLQDVFRVQEKEKNVTIEWEKLTDAEKSEEQTVKEGYDDRVLDFNSLFIDGWDKFLRTYIDTHKDFVFDKDTMYKP